MQGAIAAVKVCGRDAINQTFHRGGRGLILLDDIATILTLQGNALLLGGALMRGCSAFGSSSSSLIEDDCEFAEKNEDILTFTRGCK